MSSVWLITGAQASGKTTVADLLARQFPRGVHVRGGQFYRWVVTGWVHFDGEDRAEARRLLDLRYRLSAVAADHYAGAGFTTVVQDNIYGDDVVRWIDSIRSEPVHLVVLRPSIEVIEQRHEQRRQDSGKVAYSDAYSPRHNDGDLATTPRHLGLWLDTSTQEPVETVETVLAGAAEAVVRRR